jgi:hypothetical protein
MTALHDQLVSVIARNLDTFESQVANAEVTVSLTPNEVHLAASHGLLRRYEKLLGRRGDRIQKEESTWDNEIEGACAEFAWAKHLGVPWSGVSDLRAKDGGEMEVRWTKWPNGGLIVYAHDSDESMYVLAKGRAPVYRFVGWLRGGEAKKLASPQSFGLLVDSRKLRAMNDG